MIPRKRILIVEDESLIALDLSRRLPKLGYDVCGMIASGEEAIQRAAELNPDLILMDICLRGPVDGIAAAIAIRRQIDVPVVFLTANSDEKTLERAKSSRPSSYLLKPFKERELQIGVDMALLNHGLQAELNASRSLLEQRVLERTAELGRINDALRTEIDIREKMEAQAREQADLLDKARDAIYVCDPDGKITFWNSSAERLYGFPEVEALGRPASELLGYAHREEFTQARQQTTDQGDWNGEICQRTQSGHELTVESRWTLVNDGNGNPKKTLIVNTDITEKKKIAEQILRTQRLESVGALAGGITHDLNNVFAPIMMASDLMKGADEANRERIMDMVKTSARRGADMVKQLLVFVRGGINEKEPVPVSRIVDEVRKLMQDTLPCSINVAAMVPKDTGLVLGDATQIHQVMVNLCVNARDAMPDGGELRIQVDDLVVDRNATTVRKKPGRYIRVIVSDTGTGMPPGLVEKIFEPFFTTKEIGKGTGLGLSTVAAIVHDHQGFIEVESLEGHGTRFLVYLPACDGQLVRPETTAPRLIAGSGELIVVADDDHSVREIIKLTLEAHNYRVLLAEDGAEALTLYIQRCEEIALVITDVMMPIMNGRALIHALRKFRSDLPIIAFSAADRTSSLMGGLDTASVTVLKKPAIPEHLLLAIARALRPSAALKSSGETTIQANYSPSATIR